MHWQAYAIAPVDLGWGLLPTVEQGAELLKTCPGYDAIDDQVHYWANFAKAEILAGAAGWEGDYQDNARPRVIWLPNEGEVLYGFAWKQNNNGTTFVISPVPLDWLKHHAFNRPDQ
jgi:hypothetical protein